MSSTPRLGQLKPGQSATISDLHFEGGLKNRFEALGLRCGQEILMLRHGLLQGPLHIRVGMTEVMVRRCDARHIAINLTGRGA